MMAGRGRRPGGWAGSLLGLAVAVGSILGPTTGATAASLAAGSHTKSPIGYYNEFSSNGGRGQIHIETNNAFTTNYGDSGAWAETKTSLALVVFTSTDGDASCVYLGQWSSKGINTAKKQGPTSCSGSQDTWYALRTPGPTSTPSIAVRDGVGQVASRPRLKAVGNYTLHFGSGRDGSLELSANGDAVADTGQGALNGYWVGLSKSVAFETTQVNSVCLWVGLLDRTGISSAAKPASFVCRGEANPSNWYATK